MVANIVFVLEFMLTQWETPWIASECENADGALRLPDSNNMGSKLYDASNYDETTMVDMYRGVMAELVCLMQRLFAVQCQINENVPLDGTRIGL